MAIHRVLDEISDVACAPDRWCEENPASILRNIRGAAKLILLGLPCARCRLYYDAELKACPRCGCEERESPHAHAAPLRRAA
jgi:hypothetical protein